MKTHLKIGFSTLVFFAFFSANAQVGSSYPNEKYPHISADLQESTNMYGMLRHQITLDGIWGLGVHGTYLKKHVAYGSLEAGYGWVIANHKDYRTEDFKDHKWRPWFQAQIGYPIFQFTTATSGRFVTRQYTNSEGKEMESFYKIKVPVHRYIIVSGGYLINPYPTKIFSETINNSKFSYSALSHNFTLGLRMLSMGVANVKVKDASTGNYSTGKAARMSEIYFGFIIPVKDQITTPAGYTNLPSTGRGLEIIFRMSARHNGVGTFDFGIRALGYGKNSSDTESSAQLVIGNTFFAG